MELKEKIDNIAKMLEDNQKMLEYSQKMLEDNHNMLEHNQKILEYNEKLIENNQKNLEENEKRITEFKALLNNMNNNFYTLPIKEDSNGLFEELEIDEKLIHNIEIEKNKCIICLNYYKIHDKISYLPCLHIFHCGCIKEWLKRSNKCPLCKNKVN